MVVQLKSRQLIAIEAARILAEEFVQDYQVAKMRALKHLGVDSTQELPSNQEIEAELKRYQALFNAGKQEGLVLAMRRQAREMMSMLAHYQPRLAGEVLEGTCTAYTPISIHVFADSEKSIAIDFLDREIPFETRDRRIRITKSEYQSVPVLCFGMGEFEIEVSVFYEKDVSHSPLSPITGSPMRRISIKKLNKLIEPFDD